MATYLDEPDFWRDQAFRFEVEGDMETALHFWRAALAMARQQTANGATHDLRWLSGRLARAECVVHLVTSDQRPGSLH